MHIIGTVLFIHILRGSMRTEADSNDPYVPPQQVEGKRWNNVQNGWNVGMECISPWNRCLALPLPFLKPEGQQGGD